MWTFKVTFVHISNISAITDQILTKIFGVNFGSLIFVLHIFFGLKFFWDLYFCSNNYWTNFFGPKFFLDLKFLGGKKFFWSQHFLGSKIPFGHKHVFTQQIFLPEIFFGPKIDFGPKMCLEPKTFPTKIFLTTFFKPKISSDPKSFFKSFQAEHFRLKSCFV